MEDFLKEQVTDFLYVNYVGANGGIERFISALKSKLDLLDDSGLQIQFTNLLINTIEEKQMNHPCDCGKGENCPNLKEYRTYLRFTEIQRNKIVI